MRRGSLFIAVLLGSLLLASRLLGDEEGERLLDCGRNCLFLLSNLLGCEADLDAVMRSLPPRHPAGYSMSELQAAALHLGLRLQGVRFDKRQIRLKQPAIAYIAPPGEGHFIVLRPVGIRGKVVQVIDPPSPPVVMDYDQLLSSPVWTGRLLVPQTRAEWLISWSWIAPLAAYLVLVAEFVRRRTRSHYGARANQSV